MENYDEVCKKQTKQIIIERRRDDDEEGEDEGGEEEEGGGGEERMKLTFPSALSLYWTLRAQVRKDPIH